MAVSVARSPERKPMLGTDDQPLGTVEFASVGGDGTGVTYIELSGEVYGAENFGWDDAKWHARLPIPAGWGLVRLADGGSPAEVKP